MNKLGITLAAWLTTITIGMPLALQPVFMQADQICMEDEACWDCASMGNEVCGPDNSQGIPAGNYSITGKA